MKKVLFLLISGSGSHHSVLRSPGSSFCERRQSTFKEVQYITLIITSGFV